VKAGRQRVRVFARRAKFICSHNPNVEWSIMSRLLY